MVRINRKIQSWDERTFFLHSFEDRQWMTIPNHHVSKALPSFIFLLDHEDKQKSWLNSSIQYMWWTRGPNAFYWCSHCIRRFVKNIGYFFSCICCSWTIVHLDEDLFRPNLNLAFWKTWPQFLHKLSRIYRGIYPTDIRNYFSMNQPQHGCSALAQTNWKETYEQTILCPQYIW